MHQSKAKKRCYLIVLSIVGIMILLRLAAPSIATWYANRTIEQTKGIDGSVASVELAILVGAYSFNGINIRQSGDKKDQPLLVADKVEISLEWSALFKGEIVAELALLNPTVGLYDRPQDKIIEDELITDERTWLGLANNITPFAINKLRVENGAFVMDAESKLKRSTFEVTDIQLMMTNIANIKTEKNLASLTMTGKIQDQANLSINGSFDPNTKNPTFDINMEMARLPVAYVDKLMAFYAPFDFEAGEIDMASEINAQEGKVQGYFKVGIYQIDVFSWNEDVVEDDTDPINLALEMVGGVLATLFENDNKDLVATRVPIEGNIDSPDVSAMDAFVGILRNAFIQAYNLKVEGSVGEDSNKENATE